MVTKAKPKAVAAKKPIVRVRVNKSAAGGNYFANPKNNIQFIKTGCTLLDLALGGGWAEGRVANIIGDKSTGKTLLMIEACANFAAKYPKGKIRYRESEAAFDTPYAGALGMPVDRIDFGDPLETVEDLFEDLERIVAGAKQDELVICDSLDALSDRAEMKRNMDEGTYGAAKAKLMSQLFRRLVRDMERKNITLLIVSQIRDKINAMFGRKWTRTGGKALDFYASQVVVLANTGRLTQTIRGQARAVGIKVTAKIDKNKISLPFREADFQIRFGYGIDDPQAMVDFLNSTKRLKEVDIRPDEVKGYLNYMLELPLEKMNNEMETLREAVARNWYAIEQELITPRAKYGAMF